MFVACRRPGFPNREHEYTHSGRFVVYSACFDSPSVCVSWLVSKFLNADPAGRPCGLDVTIKDKSLRLIYMPNEDAA